MCVSKRSVTIISWAVVAVQVAWCVRVSEEAQ